MRGFVRLSLLAVVSCSWAAVAAPKNQVTEDKTAQELREFVVQDCGSCHGSTLEGGLGPDLLPARMKAFADKYLQQVIGDGLPGTAMPPWRFLLSPNDITVVTKGLKNGAFVD